MSDFPHAKKPCTECPWRTDVAPGRFPPERFATLAASAYDMSHVIFACHKSPDGREFACAGFLMRGAGHNLACRMAGANKRLDRREISDGGHPLFDNYREMAEANGVLPSDPALRDCR